MGDGTDGTTGEVTENEEVVNGLVNLVIAALQDPERGVHIETALVMAGATAGTLVLRSAVGTALDTLPPGSPVFADAVDEAGPALLDVLAATAARLGVPWHLREPQFHEGHQPLQDPGQLVATLEPAAAALFDRFGVAAADRPQHLLFAAARLLQMAGGVIDPTIGADTIVWALVVGSKTVPHPRV